MKFVYFSSLFMACALSVGAQGIYQFEDPGFDDSEWKSEYVSSFIYGSGTATEPSKDWHSFYSASGSLKKARGSSPQPVHIEDGYNGYAIKLVSAMAGSSIKKEEANGNLTTGRVNMGGIDAASSENYNFSDIEGSQSLQFAGIPDAVEFYVKFKPGSANQPDENKDFPAGRVQFILHDKYAYRDPEVEADIAEHRIAKASLLIGDTKDKWEYKKVSFVYDSNDPTVTKYLLASITTNPTPGQSIDDELCIDEFHFIYNSELESLTYGDKNITSVSEGQTIDLTGMVYDEATLDKGLVLTGKGAYTEKTYNKKTGLLTLTVKGNDWIENNANQHVYTVQFTPVVDVNEVIGDYKRLVKVTLKELATTVSSINDITLSESNEQSGTVDFTMKNFAFNGISMGDVVVTGAKLTYGDNDDINITTSEPQRITLRPEGAESEDDYITADVTLNATVSSTKDLTAQVDIQWIMEDVPVMNILAEVGAIPFNTELEGKTLKVTGSVAADEASAVIPTGDDVNVVDLKGATLTDDITSSDFAAKNPNTLFYAAEGATLKGDNVVKGQKCDNFVLTDGQSFNAPTGFTANQITYKRATVASTEEKDEVYTFVLPFTFTADKVNGTVYDLNGVYDGVLDFNSIEGSMELKANRPYLVVSKGTELLNNEGLSGEISATNDLTHEITGKGVAMVGAYKATTVPSEGNENNESWYGYNADGKFVKATTGTINPFRAAIKSTGIAPSSYALKLDGTVTGILNLENPNAKVDVYTISGVCVRKNVPAASALNGLSRGVYIVGGQKVVK